MKASRLCGVVADIWTHLVLGDLPGPPNAMGKPAEHGGVGACTCDPVHERLVLLYILRVRAGEHNSSRRGTRSSIVANACVCAAHGALDQSQEAHKTLSTGYSPLTISSGCDFSKITAQARSCLSKQAANTELPMGMLETPTQVDG
jgi:hypothetical protein